jgi:hypothetical protein
MQITHHDSRRKSVVLTGLAVRLPTPCGCGSQAAKIGADNVLVCICGVRRNSLSARTIEFLEKLVAAYGAPDKPVILRRNPD